MCWCVLYGITGGEYYELVFAVFAFATLYFFLKAFWRQSADFFADVLFVYDAGTVLSDI